MCYVENWFLCLPIALAIFLIPLPFIPISKLRNFLYDTKRGYASYLYCIGVFLAALVSCYVLFESKNIYQEVLKIQSQAKTINDGVNAIKIILVQQASVKISSKLPDKPKLTEAEVEKVLNEIPVLTGFSGVFLPNEAKTQVI